MAATFSVAQSISSEKNLRLRRSMISFIGQAGSTRIRLAQERQGVSWALITCITAWMLVASMPMVGAAQELAASTFLLLSPGRLMRPAELLSAKQSLAIITTVMPACPLMWLIFVVSI